MKLQGRSAYVTGGGGGIGRGIAIALAREGASVAVGDIDVAGAAKVADEIGDMGGKAIAMPIDVTKFSDAAALVARAEATFGKLDIAVHCAGVISVVAVEDLSETEWERVMGVNAKGVFLCCKAALPALKRNGFGRIINIASVSGKDGYQRLAHYSASKYAVLGFTNSLAKEVAREGITVNAICPGVVRTSMWNLLSEEWRQERETLEESWERQVLSFVPQGRPQTPEDIGDLAVYLTLAPSLTGQSINLDGGLMSH